MVSMPSAGRDSASGADGEGAASFKARERLVERKVTLRTCESWHASPHRLPFPTKRVVSHSCKMLPIYLFHLGGLGDEVVFLLL